MIRFRNAVLNDSGDISRIESECFPEAEAASEDSIVSRIKTFPECFYVIEVDGAVAGFVNGCVSDEHDLKDEMYADSSFHNRNGAWQMIFGLAVKPEFQHRGYASDLMNYFIDFSKSDGRKGIVLTCKERLTGFYEKFGFEDEGFSDSTHGNVRWHQMRLVFDD